MHQAISPANQLRADQAALLPRDCPRVRLPLDPEACYTNAETARAVIEISHVQRIVMKAGDVWAVLTAGRANEAINVVPPPWSYVQCNPHSVREGACIEVWFSPASARTGEVFAEIAEVVDP